MAVNQKALCEFYQNAVQEILGLVAKIEEDRYISFKYPEFGPMLISPDENDPAFFNLICPGIGTPAYVNLAPEQFLQFANQVNSTTKVIKISLEGEDLIATATGEAFIPLTDELPSMQVLAEILPRLTTALKSGVSKFVVSVREAADAGGGDSESNDDNSL